MMVPGRGEVVVQEALGRATAVVLELQQTSCKFVTSQEVEVSEDKEVVGSNGGACTALIACIPSVIYL